MVVVATFLPVLLFPQVSTRAQGASAACRSCVFMGKVIKQAGIGGGLSRLKAVGCSKLSSCSTCSQEQELPPACPKASLASAWR